MRSRTALITVLALAVLAVAAPGTQAAFGGANGPIAFSRHFPTCCGGGWDVWTINEDGSGQTNLTNMSSVTPGSNDGGPYNWYPSFSADGKKIAFASDRDTRGNNPFPDSISPTYFSYAGDEIYTMNADGSAPTRLTTLHLGVSNESYSSHSPSFSPDGKRIVFLRFPLASNGLPASNSNSIWVMNADGSNLHPLFSKETASSSHPIFSPDGSKIVWSQGYGTDAGLWQADANAADPNAAYASRQPVGIHAPGGAFDPDFSPDGKKIAFWGLDGPVAGAQLQAIWIADLVSGKTERVPTPPVSWNPTFSPDGKEIAFYTDSPAGTTLHAMNLDGSNLRLLGPTNYEGGSPSWGVKPGTALPPPSAPQPECGDGRDNDGDGKVDYPADPGCSSTNDYSESPDPIQCSDNIDNDGDGKVDYPADPGCSSATDNSESPDPPPTVEASDTPYRSSGGSHPWVDNGAWADRGAAAGDLNGDGVGDLFVRGESDLGGSPSPCGFSIYALSGRNLSRRNLSPLYRIDAPACVEGLDVMSSLGDVDGDGVSDLVAGTGQGGKNAYVFSGKDGKLLHALVSPSPQGLLDGQDNDRFGDRVGTAGDVTGDGRPDILVGAPGTNAPTGCTDRAADLAPNCHRGQGRAYIFDGSTGSLLRTLDLPSDDAKTEAAFGNSVQGPGDVDGDGVPDQLVGASGGDGALYLFSGKDGSLLRKITSPAPQDGALFGFQDTAPNSPGDVNGDGTPDIYAGAFDAGGEQTFGVGRAWVFDGKSCASPGGDCKVLYELKDPTPRVGGEFGWSMAKTDYDGDGTPDLYVGQAPHHLGADPGGTYVFSGKDGSLLRKLEVDAAEAALGWFVAAPGDLNGDGKPDFAAGAPGRGWLVVFLSGEKPSASVDDVQVKEGDSGEADVTFRVSLSAPVAENGENPVSIDYQTADDTAKAPGDYAAASGTVTFGASEQEKTVTVKVKGDTTDEPDERFLLRLANPKGATLADGEGVGTIVDDDPPPALSVNDTVVTEPSKGQTTTATFTVSLSAASAKPVTVGFATANGTATAPDDYTATSASLAFAPGETQKTVTVPVIGDNKKEGDERFFLRLANAGNATIADGEGIATIHDSKLF